MNVPCLVVILLMAAVDVPKRKDHKLVPIDLLQKKRLGFRNRNSCFSLENIKLVFLSTHVRVCIATLYVPDPIVLTFMPANFQRRICRF